MLSLQIPPQFDKYGYTFWIPSQVEPTTALAGASLPALRHVFISSMKDLQSAVSSRMMGSGSATKGSQGSALSSHDVGNAHLSTQRHPFVRIGGKQGAIHSKTSTAPEYEL